MPRWEARTGRMGRRVPGSAAALAPGALAPSVLPPSPAREIKFSLSISPLMFVRGHASRRCGAGTPVLPPLAHSALAVSLERVLGGLVPAWSRAERPGRGWPCPLRVMDGKGSSLQPCCLLLLDFPGGFAPNINNPPCTPFPTSCSSVWDGRIAMWGCPWLPQPQNTSAGWAGGAAGA